MVGLPKSYIKKYGVSKLAWRKFRADKSKPRSRGASTMARKKTRRVSNRRRPAVKARRSGRKKGGNWTPFIGAGLYGAMRGRVSTALLPLTAKMPLGGIADEAAMMGAMWAAKKFAGGKIPMLGDIAKAGMIIESARIGEAVATGQLNLGIFGNGNGNAANNNGGQVIG